MCSMFRISLWLMAVTVALISIGHNILLFKDVIVRMVVGGCYKSVDGGDGGARNVNAAVIETSSIL